jgi:hypothetical protein
VVHNSHPSIAVAIQKLLEQLAQLRDNVRRVDNVAVFEVPQILADLLAGRDALRAPAAPGLPAGRYSANEATGAAALPG